MQAAIKLSQFESVAGSPVVTTLLDLVAAIADSAHNDREVIATVADLLESGRVTLIGNFRGADVRVG
jgi:hypothetical protein